MSCILSVLSKFILSWILRFGKLFDKKKHVIHICIAKLRSDNMRWYKKLKTEWRRNFNSPRVQIEALSLISKFTVLFNIFRWASRIPRPIIIKWGSRTLSHLSILRTNPPNVPSRVAESSQRNALFPEFSTFIVATALQGMKHKRGRERSLRWNFTTPLERERDGTRAAL